MELEDFKINIDINFRNLEYRDYSKWSDEVLDDGKEIIYSKTFINDNQKIKVSFRANSETLKYCGFGIQSYEDHQVETRLTIEVL